MHPRRLLIFGLVILLAVVLGVLVRREVTLREARAPQLPATETTQPQLTVPDASQTAKAPDAPSTDDAAAATRPSFDVVRVEPSGEAIIAGRAAPGTQVELLANGSIIDRTTANESGEFVLMPPPLQPGSHELTLKTAGSGSRQAVSVSVPQPGKGDVLVVVGEPGKPSQVVQAGAPDGPGAGALPGTPGLIASPAEGTPQLRIGAVEAEGGRLFVQGSGPPGSKAMIYLNDAPLAEAQIGADGRWSLTVEKGLAQGDYKVRVDQTGADGKVVARAEVPFAAEAASSAKVASAPSAPAPDAANAPETTGTANPVVPQLGTLEVKRGDNLWRISRRAYGAGMRYSTIYQANTNQIRDPNRIYPGQIFVMPGG